MFGSHAIDHDSSRSGRWLRQHRLRFTLWLAAGEGILYVFKVLHWWEAVVLAIAGVASYFYVGRRSRSDSIREATWTFAAAQLLVLLVPIVFKIAEAVAIAVVALIAVAALIFLFTERR
jgi:cobalamin synthase